MDVSILSIRKIESTFHYYKFNTDRNSTSTLDFCDLKLSINENIYFSIAAHIRESFLLDYGAVLMQHKSLWQVALTYLDNCPKQGLNTIEYLLGRLPFENEQRLLKIIREAQKRNLLDVGK